MEFQEEHQSLRDQVFEELKLKREQRRNESFDSQRVKLGEIQSSTLNEKAISGICSRIKRRKLADVQDLVALSNGFLQTNSNITVFIKTVGAINILVKEFIGTDSTRQILAGECLLNLSLGDEVCCEKVAQFAGSYLTIYILNLTNYKLLKTCLWIMQNLAASGEKSLSILMSQKLVKNVLHVSNHVMYDDIKDECNTLLDIILSSSVSLSDEEKEEILQNISSQVKLNQHSTKTCQVLYKILQLIEFSVDPSLSQRLVEIISLNFIDVFVNNKICNDNELYYLLIIRILTNFFKIEGNLVKFIEILVKSNVQLSHLVSKLSADYFGLVKEFMWFCGTIYTSNSEIVQNYLKIDNLEENLKVSKIFVL